MSKRCTDSFAFHNRWLRLCSPMMSSQIRASSNTIGRYKWEQREVRRLVNPDLSAPAVRREVLIYRLVCQTPA